MVVVSNDDNCYTTVIQQFSSMTNMAKGQSEGFGNLYVYA
jgi:hypothetical protein